MYFFLNVQREFIASYIFGIRGRFIFQQNKHRPSVEASKVVSPHPFPQLHGRRHGIQCDNKRIDEPSEMGGEKKR